MNTKTIGTHNMIKWNEYPKDKHLLVIYKTYEIKTKEYTDIVKGTKGVSGISTMGTWYGNYWLGTASKNKLDDVTHFRDMSESLQK